jgi:sulfoxide reductase catalytic subunit YedY
MLIKSSNTGFIHPVSSDITPQAIYEQRREWLRVMAGGVAGAALAGWAGA